MTPTIIVNKVLIMKMSSFFALLFLANTLLAQNPKTDPLRWELGQGVDLKSNKSFSYSGSLQTSSSGVQWTQKNTSSSFSVISASGTWSDITKNGRLQFDVESEGSSGTLTFERKSSGYFVTIEFPSNDPNGTKVRWKVNNVTASN